MRNYLYIHGLKTTKFSTDVKNDNAAYAVDCLSLRCCWVLNVHSRTLKKHDCSPR